MVAPTSPWPFNAPLTPLNGSHLTICTRQFDATAGNGAVGTASWFNVSNAGGVVVVRALFGVCSIADLTGAGATITTGVKGQTSLFIAATLATDIDQNEVWTSTTPAIGQAIPAACKDIVIVGQGDGPPPGGIYSTIAVADITGGILSMYCIWDPITPTTTLVAAA